MPLSFNRNTPGASDVVAITQPLIQTNFQSLDTALNGPTGSASGGGNLTTYNIQNTTANFAAKPVNPIGSLHTIASTNGNPELAWINNVNATGAGPYNGTQLTGGGITAAAWVRFTISAGVITIISSYNIASVTNTGANTNITITFTRAFTDTTYDFVANFYQTGVGDTINRKLNIVTIAAGSFVFNVTETSSTSINDMPIYCAVFYGTLV